MATAFVVPIAAAAIPDTLASAPAATPTTTPTAALPTPIEASTHALRVPSGLWANEASVLVTASVAAPIHTAPTDSVASTRLEATPAASIVAHNAASAAPVHHAALHQGQRHSRAVLRAACAQPPP